jgi:hypothetical protein
VQDRLAHHGREGSRAHQNACGAAANPLDARVTVRIEGGVVRPPLNTTVESLALCEKSTQSARPGIDVKWVATGGGSDATSPRPRVPTIDGSPHLRQYPCATEYGEVASIVPLQPAP